MGIQYDLNKEIIRVIYLKDKRTPYDTRKNAAIAAGSEEEEKKKIWWAYPLTGFIDLGTLF